MRLEIVTLLTETGAELDEDGFPTEETVKETEISAEELAVKVSDTITGERAGWNVDIKLGVDIDDYETAYGEDGNKKRIRPQKLIYNGVTYNIRQPVKNLKTHQMDLLCSEVE